MIGTPCIEELDVTTLMVDRRVQRPLDMIRVRDLAKNFREIALGVLVVSRRENGDLHTIDGQTRAATCREVGYATKVTCSVYEGLTLAEEAEMFDLLNDSKRLHPVVHFQVRVISGDPAAVELDEVLTRHGWATRGGRRKTFSAVGALEKVYGAEKNIGACDTTIDVLTRAWGYGAASVNAAVVAGVGAVLIRHGDAVDVEKLVYELSAEAGGARRFLGNCRTTRESLGGSLPDAVSRAVIGRLNKRIKVNRLPDWRTQ